MLRFRELGALLLLVGVSQAIEGPMRTIMDAKNLDGFSYLFDYADDNGIEYRQFPLAGTDHVAIYFETTKTMDELNNLAAQGTTEKNQRSLLGETGLYKFFKDNGVSVKYKKGIILFKSASDKQKYNNPFHVTQYTDKEVRFFNENGVPAYKNKEAIFFLSKDAPRNVKAANLPSEKSAREAAEKCGQKGIQSTYTGSKIMFLNNNDYKKCLKSLGYGV